MSHMVVDGVTTERWCHIALLDTLAAFSGMKEKSKRECERRRFDQYHSLKKAIVASIVHPQNIVGVDGKITTLPETVRYEVVDIQYPWDSVENLRKILVDSFMSKSWARRQRAVNFLCDCILENDASAKDDLRGLIANIVMRAVKESQVSSIFEARRRDLKSPRVVLKVPSTIPPPYSRGAHNSRGANAPRYGRAGGGGGDDEGGVTTDEDEDVLVLTPADRYSSQSYLHDSISQESVDCIPHSSC